ncbi:MAG: tetratricopeptide repeat protein, partial [Thiobacillus sp.]|nr:tetratricopeptide repeat protein [Thiobacillus sp.]
MLRIPLACLVLSIGWNIAPVAIAIPLDLKEAPQAEMRLSPTQWEGSAQLTDVVASLEKGDREQAKAKLAQFLKRSPNDPRGPALAGMMLMEDKNYSAAVLSFERALVLNPNNPDLLAKLGVARLLKNEKKAGEATLRQAIALQPGEPLARRYLGWLEEGRGNLNAAGQHYLAAIKGGRLPTGSVTETHLALGRLYTALGRNEQTIRLLEPYVSRPAADGLKQALQIQLAMAYLELQRGQDAAPLIKSLERARKSDDPELQFVKAYALLATNASAARKQLQELAQAQPAFLGRTRMLIAQSYAREGKPALAAKELEALAAEVDPGDLPQVLTALTALHLSSGKANEAAKLLEAYGRKNETSPEIPYLLAEVRLQAGDTPRTQTLLKQLIAKHPDFAPAFNLLG